MSCYYELSKTFHGPCNHYVCEFKWLKSQENQNPERSSHQSV